MTRGDTVSGAWHPPGNGYSNRWVVQAVLREIVSTEQE